VHVLLVPYANEMSKLIHGDDGKIAFWKRASKSKVKKEGKAEGELRLYKNQMACQQKYYFQKRILGIFFHSTLHHHRDRDRGGSGVVHKKAILKWG